VESLAGDDPRQIGAYRLHARLGAGGMGRVYLGYSPGGRAVAVKVVHPELARDPEFMERFRREVRAAEAVSGAYTAPVVAAGPGDSPPWLATVFVTGPSLSDLVGRAGPLPEAAVWRLAGGLAEALQAIHGKGLVHRDLKPGNILIAADGPRVIDFGISRAMQGTAMTGTRTAIGTPAFMSPEQAQGHEAGPPSDVFSLGSVLAFAATGVAPFDGGEVFAIAYRLVSSEPDLSRVPPGLRPLVARCLAKDPAARPTLGQVLEAVADGSAALPATVPGAFWPDSIASLLSGAPGAPAPPAAMAPAYGTPPGMLAPGAGPQRPVQPAGSGYGMTPPGAPAYGTPPGMTPPGMTPPGMTPVPPVTLPARRSGNGRNWLIVVGVAGVGAALAGTVIALAVTAHSSSSSQSGPTAPATPAGAAAHGSAAASTSPSLAASPSDSLIAVTVCTVPADGCTLPGASQSMGVQPKEITTSGDGSAFVDGLAWTGWGTARAVGTGTLKLNDCTPNCAQGSYTSYPATVTLQGLRAYGTGLEAYSTVFVNSPAASTSYAYTKDLVPPG
jgi:hypothetical protein